MLGEPRSVSIILKLLAAPHITQKMFVNLSTVYILYTLEEVHMEPENLHGMR